MSWTTLFIMVVALCAAAWVVIRFWVQIVIMYYTIKFLFYLSVTSFVLTSVWFILRGLMRGHASADGWLQVWLFSLGLIAISFGVYVSIAMDIWKMVTGLINIILSETGKSKNN
ncbi:MAG: hypothetical protein RIR48_2293 [Bacteroidota bacterium]